VHVVANSATLCPCTEQVPNTARLLENSELLAAKLRKVMDELLDKSSDIVTETADVLYFALVKSVAAGVRMQDFERVLDRREKPSPDHR